MPTYSFRNTQTDEEFELFMKISEREQYLTDNPHIVQTMRCVPGISYNDAKKPDDSFRDILREIKKANPRGEVNTF